MISHRLPAAVAAALATRACRRQPVFPSALCDPDRDRALPRRGGGEGERGCACALHEEVQVAGLRVAEGACVRMRMRAAAPRAARR